MKVTKITVGRLYNLGSYEHVRYEVAVEIQPGESSKTAMIGLERLMEALSPERTWGVQSAGELEREAHHLTEMGKHLIEKNEQEFRRRYGHFEGDPTEYVERCGKMHAENVTKRAKAVQRAATARRLLDDLGGAAVWKDAKLDWEDDSDFED
jgi:hypothetical protein